jgi:acetyl esterase
MNRLAGLDAQTRALVERLSADFRRPPTLENMRAPLEPQDVRELAPGPLLDVTDLVIPRESPVPIRLFVPRIPAPRPSLIWLHPGGFVSGDIEDVDAVCRTLAADGRCTVVSIDYRLAPEHSFPAAVDDVTLVFEWLVAHAGTLGLDRERIAIGGQSAGATIAASTALRLRDRQARRPAFQILAYPILDPVLDKPSYTENDHDFLFTTEATAWCWKQYLGDKPPTPLAAPLTMPRLDGLPPSLILAAGFDPSRDDSRLYHQRLIDEGIDSELVEYPHTIHAFLSFVAELDVASEALALISTRLRERLASSQSWRLHHVALPYTPGAQDSARRFYRELLGMTEIPVPDAFAGRSFVWFAAGTAELHLIPETACSPEADPSDRHPCLSVDNLDETLSRLEAAGYHIDRYDSLPVRPQAFVRDPFGNLIELTR